MRKQKRDLLDQMRPDSIAAEGANWQQRKSGETRVRILEATIDSLVENGYSGLSTSAVTERAGISRGAMHHHFPTKMALVAAVVGFGATLAAVYGPGHFGSISRFLDTYWAQRRTARAD